MNNSAKFFLHDLHIKLKSNPEAIFIIVTGNESCDLDSIVSAIGYAYLKTKKESRSGVIYIPYCNVPKDDLDLRPEVIYWLKVVGLTKDDLFNAGELDWLFRTESTKEIQLILVDHLHVEQSNHFRNCPVLEIVDHRPLPKDFKQPDSCTYFNVHFVGSCSTLITELLFEGLESSEIPKDLCHLLYGALLADNDGFSNFAIEMKKATKRDLLACEKIVKQGGEALLNQGERSIDVYEKIKMAKFDISERPLLKPSSSVSFGGSDDPARIFPIRSCFNGLGIILPVAAGRFAPFLMKSKTSCIVKSHITFVTGLSLFDLFRRDSKRVIIEHYPVIICSTIIGIDCQKITRMSNFFDEASAFCLQQCAHTLVCVTVGRIPHSGTSCAGCNPGEAVLGDGTRRGIVVTAPPQHLDFANKLWRYLINNSEALNLRSIGDGKCCKPSTVMHPDIHIAVVTNPYTTRKQLMPVLYDFLKNEYL